jgi:hypothetical protein
MRNAKPIGMAWALVAAWLPFIAGCVAPSGAPAQRALYNLPPFRNSEIKTAIVWNPRFTPRDPNAFWEYARNYAPKYLLQSLNAAAAADGNHFNLRPVKRGRGSILNFSTPGRRMRENGSKSLLCSGAWHEDPEFNLPEPSTT